MLLKNVLYFKIFLWFYWRGREYALFFFKKHIFKKVLTKIMLLYEHNFGTTLQRHRNILVKKRKLTNLVVLHIANLNY